MYFLVDCTSGGVAELSVCTVCTYEKVYQLIDDTYKFSAFLTDCCPALKPINLFAFTESYLHYSLDLLKIKRMKLCYANCTKSQFDIMFFHSLNL